jgi:hypothetical protein
LGIIDAIAKLAATTVPAVIKPVNSKMKRTTPPIQK